MALFLFYRDLKEVRNRNEKGVKEKMNKKILALGVVCLLASSFVVTAKVVDYLSNDVEASASVESPLVLTIRNDAPFSGTEWCTGEYVPVAGFSEDDLTSVDILGGESFGFWVHVENLADAEISGLLEVSATCDEGLGEVGGNVADFTVEYDVYEMHSDGTNDVHHIGPASVQRDTWNSASETSDFFLYPLNEFYVYVQVNFVPAAMGTYSFSAQLVPAAV